MILDQGSMTQLLILVNLFDGNDKPASIAKNIGITLSGVNYHLKILRKRDLIDENNVISKKGYSFLESGLNSLRGFVSENLAKIDNIVTWEAIADRHIAKEEPVTVYMTAGYLHAGLPGDGTNGIAQNSAETGEVVAVASISGMITFEFGKIAIAVLPAVEDVKNYNALKELAASELNAGAGKIAVVGEEALMTVKGTGRNPDIEFGSLQAVFEAATRGLDSTLFISSRRFHYLLSELKELQNKYKEIAIRIKYL